MPALSQSPRPPMGQNLFPELMPQPQCLTHIIYASAARAPFSSDALNELLRDVRARNAASGITGMLLYSDGCFFQTLEGESEIVTKLYEKIAHDPRHLNATLIVRENIARRAFKDWTMGYANASRDELAVIPGLNDFFGSGSALTAIDDGRAKTLLKAFSEGRWRSTVSVRGSVSRVSSY